MERVNNKPIRLFIRIVVRIAIVSSITVPLGGLYIWALVSLKPEQFKVLINTLLWLPCLLLGINLLIVRFSLGPLIRIVDKHQKGVEITGRDRLKAERNALIFPYLNILFSTWWFSLGGAILAWLMIDKGKLSEESAMYIFGSAVSIGIATGLGVFYTVKKPIRDALILVFEKSDVPDEKPPFFVPISVKLTSSLLLVIALILILLSLISFASFKDAINKGVQEVQRKKLISLGPELVRKANGEKDALIGLLKMASRSGTAFCFADDNFVIETCPNVTPPPDVLEKLSSTPAGEGVMDGNNEWNWAWVNPGKIRGRILNGWKLTDPAFMKASFKDYFIKIAIVGIFVGLGLGILFALDISRPLKELGKAAIRIAEGDMETRTIPTSEDETGILARAFNRMTGVLLSQLNSELERSHLMLLSIREAARTLAPISKDLVIIVNEQATGSVEQASAAEEAATTSQEITTVSKQIAQHAIEVADSSEGALKLTGEGQERLKLTRATFDDIDDKVENITEAVIKLGEQSQAIGGILEIIDEISDQTNLLAFNASLEAVGAGKHGRRFGVVAQEIRRLAKNTAKSTEQIKEIITRMQKSVALSVMLAEEGDKAVDTGKIVMEELAKLLEEIFEMNTNATPRLKEIGLMTSQQSTASDEMTKTIETVRETAQTSSASAGELQSSISELGILVAQLQTHLDRDDSNEENI